MLQSDEVDQTEKKQLIRKYCIFFSQTEVEFLFWHLSNSILMSPAILNSYDPISNWIIFDAGKRTIIRFKIKALWNMKGLNPYLSLNGTYFIFEFRLYIVRVVDHLPQCMVIFKKHFLSYLQWGCGRDYVPYKSYYRTHFYNYAID